MVPGKFQEQVMVRSLSLAVLLAMTAIASAQTTSDLRADWSDAANPNGPWSYRQGSSLLPSIPVFSFGTIGGTFIPQPAWAPSNNNGSFLPAMCKAQNLISGIDSQIGDVLVHTTDPANGSGFGNATIRWTCPGDGLASVTGGVWMTRDIGRSNHWDIVRNSVSLTSGDISSGDPFNRSNPFLLTTGVGGAAAVTNFPVFAGDTVELVLSRTSASGDIVGVNYFVTFTPVPEPLTLLIFGLFMLRRQR